jgi:hypothetical protein
MHSSRDLGEEEDTLLAQFLLWIPTVVAMGGVGMSTMEEEVVAGMVIKDI